MLSQLGAFVVQTVVLWLLTGGVVAYDVPLCLQGRVHPAWDLPKVTGVHDDYQPYNSDRAPNVFCSNHTLVVETRLSSFVVGYAYSSGMLVLREPLGYGTLKVTAQLPKGKGLFPRIGLLPYDAMYGRSTQCAYPVHGDCLHPTNGFVTLASTVNDWTFMPVLQNVHLGLPGTPSFPPPPEDRTVVTGMDSDWWDRPHVWELHRTASQLSMAVDGAETFQVEADELLHFLEDYRGSNEGVKEVYGDVPMAPFDDSNPFQLLVHTAVGGPLPCSECNCCPADRRFLLLNTSINDRPHSRLLLHAVQFTPLQPHSHLSLYLLAMLLPVLAIALASLHVPATDGLLRQLQGAARGLWGRRWNNRTSVSTSRPSDYGSGLTPGPAATTHSQLRI
eukprot:GGOE01061718.1.p1 GENE.GGOE01061718.1~~GGOE01061718.1.p1  ORF type:complete len:390 (+),score=89.57 GGOE01061718.1:83-1252(+)